MQEFNLIAKVLIITGIVLIICGGALFLACKMPWFGKLPGDIYIKKENVSFYFPVVTCLIASLIVSAILYLIFRK